MKSIKRLFVLWFCVLSAVAMLFLLRMVRENQVMRGYERVVSGNGQLMRLPALARELTVLTEQYFIYYNPEVLKKINERAAAFDVILRSHPAPPDVHDCQFYHRTLGNMLQAIALAVNGASEVGNPYLYYYDGQIGLRTQGEYFILQSERFAFSMVAFQSRRYEQILLDNQAQAQVVNRIGMISLVLLGATLVSTGVRMLRDMQRISQQALMLSDGNWNIKAMEKSRYGEINHVIEALNAMSRNIAANTQLQQEKVLLEQSYIQEKIQSMQKDRLLRDAKIQALQMQINPHFLFNTFNMVSRSALLKDNHTTIALIEAISNIMRYTMNSGATASFKDELLALRSYLDIQIVRFQDIIDFSLKVEDEELLEGIQLPPLVVQPVVENAIMHGVTDVPRRGSIRIEILSAPDSMLIRVADNGKGIAPDRLARLTAEMAQDAPAADTRIGLRNVAQRLAHLFDRKDLLSVVSECGKGTVVTLTIPKGGVKTV